MSDSIKCPIWGTPAELLSGRDYGDKELFHSHRAGGRYVISGTAKSMLASLEEDDRIKLTTWIVDQNRLGNREPFIGSTLIRGVKTWPQIDIFERQTRLLLYLKKKAAQNLGFGANWHGDEPGQRDLNEMIAWTASRDHREVHYLIEQSEKAELVEKVGPYKGTVRLTAAGFARVHEMESGGRLSSQAFVAMWFDASLNDAYSDGFARAIINAGYKPLRIDQKEHVNKIDDEIIAEIRRSRFVVADFTCEPDKPRGGVYFEAGFAHGLKIPVIWTCRQDVIDHVHFDTRQFNHIVWKDPTELYEKLRNRIAAVIGDGPLRKPS